MDYIRAFGLDRSIFVELKLTSVATGTILNFSDVPQLRGAYVQAIEAYTVSQVAKTPTQNTVVTDSAKTEFLMTFVQEQDNRYENVPYYTLMPTNNGGLLRFFNNIKININKSFVFMGGATAVANTSLAFNFWYSDKPVRFN